MENLPVGKQTYLTLAQAVEDVLVFGRECAIPYSRYHKLDDGKAYQIVKIIFKTIAEALRRKERVVIEGLGAFKTTVYKPSFYSVGNPPRYKYLTRKPRVFFTPCASLHKCTFSLEDYLRLNNITMEEYLENQAELKRKKIAYNKQYRRDRRARGEE